MSELNEYLLRDFYPVSSIEEIESIDINEADLVAIDPELLSTCRALSSLSLGGNKISSIDRHVFRKANRLSELDLSNNGLEHLSAKAFKHLSQLSVLRLCWNKLTRIDERLLTNHSPTERQRANLSSSFRLSRKAELRLCLSKYNP